MNAPYDLPRTNASMSQLAAWLCESHRTTLRCHRNHDASQWIGPHVPIVNLPQWEVGHVAWFLERWCLRRPGGWRIPSIMPDADALYDSMRIDHCARWSLPLPGPDETLAYLEQVTESVLDHIESRKAYRDFHTPERADVFAGFRTCALSPR